jgi:hypothetical protein
MLMDYGQKSPGTAKPGDWAWFSCETGSGRVKISPQAEVFGCLDAKIKGLSEDIPARRLLCSCPKNAHQAFVSPASHLLQTQIPVSPRQA